MKRLLALAFAGVLSCGLHAQTVDTTVCDVLKNPQSFNGKMVRIKGTVAAGFDTFVIKGEGCGHKVNDIWLAYPEGTKAKSGPAAVVQIQAASNFTGTVPTVSQTPVSIDKKDKEFKQFDSLLSTPAKSNGMCLGCMKYEVNATLTGRLDAVESAALERDKSGKLINIGGFGNLNSYRTRLVLQSVAEVSPKEIDYSKVVATTKGESSDAGGPGPGGPGGGDSSSSDPFAALQKAAKAMGPGNALGAQLDRDAAAFGNKSDKSNTVTLSYGSTFEVLAKEEGKATVESPDGLLFHCTLNKSRLSGDALTRAVAHMGAHIADVRTPAAGFENVGLYELEYRAWVQTVISGVPGGQKSLSVPGGYILWNLAWPAAERDGSLDSALKDYLAKEQLLAR
jgi:hypothetical protein